MSSPQRRGACPGLSAPMPTGDGLLVRLAPTDAMPCDAFVALCAAARSHGNGTMEVTARGSLQVRGLTPTSAPLFAADVAGLAIAISGGVAVVANPLPDQPDAVIDAARLAAELREAMAAARLPLAPKFSVVVDGGGPLHLDGLAADIRLRVAGPVEAPRLLVALGTGEGGARLGGGSFGNAGWVGDAGWLGDIAPERAVDVVLGLLGEIAALGSGARGGDLLRLAGAEALRSRFAIAPAPAPPPRWPADWVGAHPLSDGTVALGIALAFGHAEAEALAQLAGVAAAHGVRSVRPAPDRVLMLIGASPAGAAALAEAAERLGFVAQASDPRRRVAACPGAPACASGFIAARSLAAAIAPQLAGLRDGIAVHVSGCAKGCAHPRPAAFTVVGDARGCGLVRNGTARTQPDRHVAPDRVAAEVARIFEKRGEAVHG